jgi:putative addiction module CopG family antidote
MTLELDERSAVFVQQQIDCGNFPDAMAVVQTALEQLAAELEDIGDLKQLRKEIDEGLASGVADDGVFERVLQKYGLASRAA